MLRILISSLLLTAVACSHNALPSAPVSTVDLGGAAVSQPIAGGDLALSAGDLALPEDNSCPTFAVGHQGGACTANPLTLCLYDDPQGADLLDCQCVAGHWSCGQASLGSQGLSCGGLPPASDQPCSGDFECHFCYGNGPSSMWSSLCSCKKGQLPTCAEQFQGCAE